MAEATVIYLEIDEDITSAINKVGAAKGTTVSIVVPKRSTMLQSLINLKLLKKAADEQGKKLALITTDRTAVHLAGQVGVAVAENLKAEAKIPQPRQNQPETSDVIEDSDEEPVPKNEESRIKNQESGPVVSPAVPVIKSREVGEAEPEDTQAIAATAATQAPIAAAAQKIKDAVKVPDFNALQRRLIWGGGAVLLIIAWFIGSYFWTNASVKLFAKGTQVAADFNFSVDPTIKTSDPGKGIVAGQLLQTDKTLTGSFTPTGQKDLGTKSAGTMTITNYCYNPGNIPAGTILTSGNGLKFISTEAVTVADKALTAGVCVNPPTAQVHVQASQNGDQYNLAPTTYSVGGYSQSQVKGTGNQMTGGTSKIATVVTQADIDKAKTGLLEKDKDGAQKELEAKVGSDALVLGVSFAQNVGEVTSSPSVGEEATAATLTVKITNTELAVGKSDYAKVIQALEQKAVGDQNQIYDDGITSATVTAVGVKDPSGRQNFHFNGNSYAGAKIDTAAVAKQLKGLRYGDAADVAAKLPGIEKADISIWPGWATSMPQIPGHIKVEIKVAGK